MANVLTIRLPSSLLAKVDRKAAALGRARAEHVRQVLEEDVASGHIRPKRFASLSLKGRYAQGGGSRDAATRRAMLGAARRLASARAKQNDPGWLDQLRAQYTEKVCKRTLKLNQTFPLAQG